MITNICTIGTFRNVRNVGLVQSEATQKKMLLKIGTGGLTMATKRVCDRCGAEINPTSSATYVNVRSAFLEESPDIELCCSCTMQIKEWLKSRVEEGKKDG